MAKPLIGIPGLAPFGNLYLPSALIPFISRRVSGEKVSRDGLEPSTPSLKGMCPARRQIFFSFQLFNQFSRTERCNAAI